jgi:hypothetical protein
MRAGVIQLPNGAGVQVALNPVPVTVNGVTYLSANCSNGSLCDPSGIVLIDRPFFATRGVELQ